MTRKTKGIVVLSLICTCIVALIISIVLIVNKANSNPFVGTWISAAGNGSYTFHEDASFRAHNPGEKLPVLKVPYNGTLNGTYAYDKSEKEISMTLSVYSKEITCLYTYDFEDDTLILTDKKSGKVSKYNLVAAQD